MTRPKHVLTVAQREAAEHARDVREASTPRLGWCEDKAEARWTKKGVAYVVRVLGPAVSKRRGVALDPPFQVFSPEGVKMGGSSHLSRAQKLAEVLLEPLPPTAKKPLDKHGKRW